MSNSKNTAASTPTPTPVVTVQSIHPVVVVGNIDATQAFYTDLFNLPTTFDADWFVQLRAEAPGAVELAAVHAGHPTVPSGWETPANVLVTVEVDDATAARARAERMGLAPVMELRDETFGQRHFMVADPDGVLVDVVEYLFIPDSER
ncbi:MAG: VOC family protein [Actinomycetota bacterium]